MWQSITAFAIMLYSICTENFIGKKVIIYCIYNGHITGKGNIKEKENKRLISFYRNKQIRKEGIQQQSHILHS